MMNKLKLSRDILMSYLCVVIILWGLLSYGEILCKNVRPNPQYSDWNLITIFYK